MSTYELGHPPLAIASAAAVLERAGYAPTKLDVSVEPIDDERLAAADAVVISVPMHTALRLGVRVAERARAMNPSVRIVFIGLYAVLNMGHLVPRFGDAVLAGEIEDALVELLAGADVGPVVLRKLDFIPPSREGLPELARYAKLVTASGEVLAGAVESTRGCKYHCTHCPIPPVYDGRFFVVPKDVVMRDVDALVAQGAGHITFADPDFLNGPGHAMRIARALHAAHPTLTFDFTAKVEHLVRDHHRLAELVTLGASFVVSAVESLSDRVLEVLDKGHTRADFERALAACEQAGLVMRPTFVAFTPWTTLDDYVELIQLIIDRDLVDHIDAIQLSVRLLVPPGSLLLAHPQMTPHLIDLDVERFTWTWRHPDPRMDELARQIAAAAQGEDFGFDRVLDVLRAMTSTAAHAHRARQTRVAGARVKSVPRLTEPWFC